MSTICKAMIATTSFKMLTLRNVRLFNRLKKGKPNILKKSYHLVWQVILVD